MNALKIVGLGTLGALAGWHIATGGDISVLPAYLIFFNALALAAALGRRKFRKKDR